MAKQTIDWTVADLEALIGSEETSNLEFKDGRSLLNEPKKKEEIARDVSAMANAAGGIIVYGLHETNGVATSIAGCPAEYGKAEWFDQVITNNIEPKVQGVVIKRIDLPEGKMALVVEIPKAMSFAPHQSKPNKNLLSSLQHDDSAHVRPRSAGSHAPVHCTRTVSEAPIRG